jgi:hypothetical protein
MAMNVIGNGMMDNFQVLTIKTSVNLTVRIQNSAILYPPFSLQTFNIENNRLQSGEQKL